ncbi:endonuclease/exonuclease/phosphatase family protein [Winogradskya humida]|uniref:Endonuclease n=1 Tax=Winogradskya humida TaxID=113566 RepID=A0ABQ3ZS54_9ACTN|nr:endonuclease/exonuclease/phosphatase family protein [Actinoplanes humidus]GIE21406.1 endonuclease [Actinoplanes humidus]
MTITSSDPVARPARVRRTLWLVVLWVLVLPGAGWAAVRLGGWERGPLVQLFAFTPYIAAWSVLPAVLALATRRWLVGAVAVVTAALFALSVLPRAIADNDRGPQSGVKLQVMTQNMLFGTADAAEIVSYVRDNDVSVLALQEFSPGAVDSLAKAGLGDLLPYSVLGAEWGASGSGLYSRFPITDPGVKRNVAGGFNQAHGTVQPPGGRAFIVESAHPAAPSALSAENNWRADLAAEPRPDANGTARIVLGDFNSTLDHKPLRDLIGDGYRDAAAATGEGLIGTWGPYDGDPIPPVTIDHVLVDKRLGVSDVSVHTTRHSDHRAVIASIVIPAA